MAHKGWIKYYHNWDLDQFLARHKPSQESDPGVFWISVDTPSLPGPKPSPPDLNYVTGCWDQLVRSEPNITADDIKAIATATGYNTGKWLVFRKSQSVDEVWDTIATATVQGRLGTGAKVSSRNSAQTSKGQQHVICVYTRDFCDQEDVLRVEQTLRSLGVEGQLSYKADIYTELGIYFRNQWGLKPTLYTSHQ